MARREQKLQLAISMYRELESKYPNTEEGRVAKVSLGKLLLATGQASEAEALFASHVSSGGTLQEEALVGRAEALDRMGRTALERDAWQTLLQRYPSSVYAPRARQQLQRLNALDVTDPP